MEESVRKGRHEDGSLSVPAAELRAAVDALVFRHQVELQKCLAAWLCCPEELQGSGQPLCHQEDPKCNMQSEKLRYAWVPEHTSEGSPPQPVSSTSLSIPGSVHVDEPPRQRSALAKGGSTAAFVPQAQRELQSHGSALRLSAPARPSLQQKQNRRAVVVKGRFGGGRRTMNAHNFLIKSKRDEALSNQTKLQRLITNRYYEWSSCCLIACNAIFIGSQAQVYALRAADNAQHGRPQENGDPVGFTVVQVLFCLAFAVDLGLRWSADGFLGFLVNAEVTWNVFDILLVFFNILDTFISLAWGTGSQQNVFLANWSVLRVMRVVRIVRVARVIRIMRFFKELRMMVYSILGSLKSLVWVMMILMLLFFIFGICLTTGTMERLSTTEMWLDDSHQSLITYFGRLDNAILHLYMAMTGGRDWCEYYEALAPLGWTYRCLFLLFISFAILAVFNIVTGVFVESALQCNNTDRDIIVAEELAEKDSYLSNMEKVFEEMDDDGTGNISMEEFEKKLNDERVIAYFNALKLDASDARKLFTLLDYDESGEIDITEFLAGCHKLKGESRALDMAIMQLEVRYLGEAIHHVQRFVEDGFAALALAEATEGAPLVGTCATGT